MKDDTIQLDHGSGGRATHELIEELFVSAFSNPYLAELNDSAVLPVGGVKLAFTTDSYVVDPLFFPGGDIGSLAVHGTVNDLAMRGAHPLYLTTGFIIEEGLPRTVLERVVESMAGAAAKASVAIVSGDTKVVPQGKGDKLFINTAGVGIVPEGVNIAGNLACAGDVVIINGTIGDHGMAVLCRREGLRMETEIRSDSAALNGLVETILAACPGVHVLRDPTRGGVATTLNEIARQSRVGIALDEEGLPVAEDVAGACELLGLDPLYVANEGKVLAVVPQACERLVLEAMRSHQLGRRACRIGRVEGDHPGRVYLVTRLGGHRLVDMLRGEQLPRIC